MVIALLSRFQNDAHVRVIDVEPDQTMEEVATLCAAPAVDRQVRHPNRTKPLRVRLTTPDDSARPFDFKTTVREAGFRHYECVDVFVE
jgi:Toluene-4-monooxygenase system protein B (TmoB)